MRILILYPFLVRSGSLGGVARVTRLVDYLDRRGHDVWLACFGTPEEIADRESYEDVRRRCREMIVLPPQQRGLVHKTTALLFDRRPTYVDHYTSSPMQAEVARVLQTEAIDVFHVEFTYLGDYVAQAAGTGCATVLVDEELNFRAHRLRFETAPHSLRGLRALWESKRFERHELAAASRFDKVLAIVEAERDLLVDRLPDLDIGIYPNTVDTSYFTPQTVEPDPHAMVFVGNFEHYPNADGIRWFVREVLPFVRESVPTARLDIIGANATPGVRALEQDAGVRVLGYVDDIRPHLARAAVFVCPLINGGGMRGKALEALAMELPVIATPIGIDGIAARDGEEALIAPDAAAFATAVVRLLGDADLRRRLGQAGRTLVSERYDDAVVFAELERVYQALAERAHARRTARTTPAPASALSGVIRT